MQEIYALKVPPYVEEESFHHLLTIVSEKKRKKIERMVRVEDKYRMLLGDVLIRYIASDIYNISPASIQFEYNEYGKPFFKGGGFSFNLSHAGNWIVCIINDGPVGIDIEKIQPIDLSIAESFFSIDEWSDLYQKSSEIERLEYFFDLWTLKESYVKARGKGLSIPLNSFTIRKTDCSNITIRTNETQDAIFLRQYNLDSQYKLSVCSTVDNFPEEIILARLLSAPDYINLKS
ncbi:4'-phosphopantetheinyl transferase family protein [Bacillus rhizoplanae]|uniref:4'-phosphopantetheinyl transferase family protein n=1 Tax=Bacillus rhizoplanae TaxID=2880966 RepID=UPI003D262758